MEAAQATSPAWIVVTPTKNESWIIDRFVSAASCWADHVIVADQGSTDGTPEIVQRAPKARLVRNESPIFDENHRQKLLLEHARKIEGRRILIGLDADEAFSANCTASKDWARIAQAAPGTVLRFRWVNVLPGFKTAWIQPGFVALGFVDDNSPHQGRTIHSPRVPQPPGAPTLDLEEIVVLHFQYVLWDRMRSKQRWYQAWEYLKHRRKTPLQIFREYNHMHGSWGKDEIHPVEPEWLAGYEQAGIDFRSIECERVTWWDREVAGMLQEHGPEFFRRIDIWDKDWSVFARQIGMSGVDFRDPRSRFERIAHSCLRRTQQRRGHPAVRAFEKLLRLRGW